ncbi:MAG: hypothetical protein HY885_13815 [Deltaproteobacteria bacterium]|nr:hypothetical protein [Deltaproteobacteria bacterium]
MDSCYFPREMEEGIKRAVKETTERLTAEAAKNEERPRKTFEGEKNVLATRISALEQVAADQKKQLDLLASQLDKAYGKVQDIASRRFPAPGSAIMGNPRKVPARMRESKKKFKRSSVQTFQRENIRTPNRCNV